MAAPARRSPVLRFLKFCLVGLGCSALASGLWLTGAVSSLEGWSFDLRAKALAPSRKPSPEIVLVMLDQYSLDQAEENGWTWPWPREAYGYVARYCAAGGAKAIGFDVYFTEGSSYGVEDDERFASALAESGRAVGVLNLSRTDKGATALPAAYGSKLPAIAAAPGFVEAYADHIARKSAYLNLEEIDGANAALGNVVIDPDPDGIFRRVAPVFELGGKLAPSFGLSLYLLGHEGAPVKAAKGRLAVGNAWVPLDAEGNALLRFKGPSGTHEKYNAWSVIQSAVRLEEGEGAELAVPPETFKGKYVILGFTAAGLYDLRPSPMGKNYTGMEIHATFLDNLLSGDFLRGTPSAVALLAVFAMGLGSSILLRALKKAWAKALVFVLLLALPVGLPFALYAGGISFPLVPGTIAVFFSLAGTVIYNYATEGKQKAFIKGAFKQYLSPIVIEQLIANPERLNLGGERRELSMFFSDIQGFTSLSEVLTPEELTAVLNDYLSAMTDIIQDEHGTVDKYEGDAIIAFWNAPLDLPDHALRAVRAGLRCQEKLAEMRPALKARTGKELFMRVGLNSGPAVVGNMGSKTRFDYTMMGDAVNLAARLEGVNKQFGTYTMISANTLKLLPADSGIACRELSRIAVVGKKVPITVYEPMREAEFAARKPVLDAFADALALYYQGKFDAALDAFRAMAEKDPPAARYAAQCERLIASPPSEWAGVWAMTEK